MSDEIKVTILIPKEIHHDLKIEAAKHNSTIKELVIDSIKIKNILTKKDGSFKNDFDNSDLKRIEKIFKTKN